MVRAPAVYLGISGGGLRFKSPDGHFSCTYPKQIHIMSFRLRTPLSQSLPENSENLDHLLDHFILCLSRVAV